MKKSLDNHVRCPRKTITPDLNGNSAQVQGLCDFCWMEYSFCWSEYCIHEWYEVLVQHGQQSPTNGGIDSPSLRNS
ncbi:MAG TPA: hypothetical protein VK203_28365 [Nostocaceae cyanobacterium]|nr:hypothetical protein [Nostocaceae cyanobacterium]